jgi:hypothetical protein
MRTPTFWKSQDAPPDNLNVAQTAFDPVKNRAVKVALWLTKRRSCEAVAWSRDQQRQVVLRAK